MEHNEPVFHDNRLCLRKYFNKRQMKRQLIVSSWWPTQDASLCQKPRLASILNRKHSHIHWANRSENWNGTMWLFVVRIDRFTPWSHCRKEKVWSRFNFPPNHIEVLPRTMLNDECSDSIDPRTPADWNTYRACHRLILLCCVSLPATAFVIPTFKLCTFLAPSSWVRSSVCAFVLPVTSISQQPDARHRFHSYEAWIINIDKDELFRNE